MSRRILGEPIAAAIREDVRNRARAAQSALGRPVTLALVASADESAQIYAQRLRKDAEALGVAVLLTSLAAASDTRAAIAEIRRLADDRAVDGILLQTPLPAGVDAAAAAEAIPPAKDVDGASTASAGFAALGRAGGFLPATAAAVMEVVRASGVAVAGADAVVLGRSATVGRPAAFGLVSADATVTICHSKSRDLASQVRRADILVVAIGKPAFVPADWVKPGALVVDVGMHRVTDVTRASALYAHDPARLAAVAAKGFALVGDCEPSVERTAGAWTPVPGGVGPITSALLLRHTVAAAERVRSF